MFDWNYFKEKYPDIIQLYEQTPQDKEWHGEGNVATHTKMVLESLHSDQEYSLLSGKEQFVLSYAAFFHDYAKPFSTKEENGRIVSPGHAKRGSLMFREMFFDTLDFQERENISLLIRYHGYPLHYYEKPELDIVRMSEILNLRFLYLLSKADINGRIAKDKEELLLQVDFFKEKAVEYNCFKNSLQWESIEEREFFFSHGYRYSPYPKERPYVYILSGLPGVGKDYFVSKKQFPVVSFDDIRRKWKVKRGDKKMEGRVIQEAKSQMKKYLAEKQPFIFNGTNLNKENRQKWINLFKEYDSVVEIIYFEKKMKTILNQNRNRKYIVPEEVILNYLKKMEVPSKEECDIITYKIQKKDFF